MPRKMAKIGLSAIHWDRENWKIGVKVRLIGPAFPNLIQVHRKLGCVQWFFLPQVLAWGNDFVPRF